MTNLWGKAKSGLETVSIMVIYVGFVVALFVIAYTLGKLDAEKEFQKELAIASAKQGAKDYEKLSQVIDAHEATQSYLATVRAESDRMRKLLASREAELAKLNAGGRNARCESLLRDGVELLGGCRERLIECAGKHDVLLRVVK